VIGRLSGDRVRGGVVVQVGVQGPGQGVGGDDVEPTVLHERRDVGHRVQQLLHAGTDPLLRRAAPRPGTGARCAGQAEQVGTFGLVELQGLGERVQHAVRHALGVAALQPRVVLDAHTGQQGGLLAAQAGDAPMAAVGGQAGLLGGDLAASGDQELAQLLPGVHEKKARSRARGEGVPAGTP
jgi:hypothetical protein